MKIYAGKIWIYGNFIITSFSNASTKLSVVSCFITFLQIAFTRFVTISSGEDEANAISGHQIKKLLKFSERIY